MPRHGFSGVSRSRATFISMLGLLVILLAACGLVSPSTPVADTALTTQGDDGVLLVTANAFSANLARGKHSWRPLTDTASVYSSTMQALPDASATLDTKYQTLSPRLDYRVAFKTTGTYYVWAYGRAADQTPLNGDSLHIGLNGKPVATSSRLTNLPKTYGWVNKTMAGKAATVQVSSPGTYTLNVWMREDGARLSALALSADARYVPGKTTVAAPVSTPPASTPPTNPVIAPVPARSADAFIDSVGVNTHFHYDDTVWGSRYDLIKTKLIASGIRHLRDGLYTYSAASRDSFYYSRLRELGAAGFRFNLIAGMNTSFGEMTNFDLLDDVYDWTNGTVVAYEGVNEPDIQDVSDWISQTTTVQRNLYEGVKSNPRLSHLAVIGPSLVWQYDELSNLSQYMDYGNSHPYNGGSMPMLTGYGSLEFNIGNAVKISGTDPIMATEVGYHNALNTTDGHNPTSEAASATYIPRLLLSFFNRGIKRTYLYEFIDTHADASLTQPGAHFGLLRNDGSEKPAYVAVKTLLGLLRDPGASFTPGALRFALAGDTQDVQQTLLQKRDGSFYLALWVERSSWDRDARRDLAAGTQALRVQLGDPIESATVYKLGADGKATATPLALQNGELTLNVDDKLALIALVPATN